RLNDLGVIIDVSQMSTKALEQVAQLSRTPLVASHSAPRAMVDIPRNLSDKEMQLIKNSGGVVQIVAFSQYLRPLTQQTQDKLNEMRKDFDLPPLGILSKPGQRTASVDEDSLKQNAKMLEGVLQ
ncbi:membrane dipeptidase, partial [Mesorhizobium japonicum]|uniref:membrane dipeptidase n=1 Tax=Mesorhizobium japonicum TaxID=2066070 RepID=UPI003B5BD66B